MFKILGMWVVSGVAKYEVKIRASVDFALFHPAGGNHHIDSVVCIARMSDSCFYLIRGA